MAQRISRAKRTVSGVRFDAPGDPATVLRVLYLVFNEGYSTADTDWAQIVEWYDELAMITDSPVVRLNRAVAVGEADGARAGLAALETVDPSVPRHQAVEAYLRERSGDLAHAVRLYADAARAATNLAERDHLTRQAGRLHEVLRGRPH
ncbi:putative RNA polymerase sigma factor [Nakamurella sp. UYEF19]